LRATVALRSLLIKNKRDKVSQKPFNEHNIQCCQCFEFDYQ
jgi:hypothetical protein